MALLWQKRSAGKTYEVRQAGNSLRLYTDGTFHSQYNPASPLNGSIWDLLLLPALMLSAPPQRVLVLGVGGGAIIRQLQQLVGPGEIVGVELDPLHLQIARRWFGLAGKRRVSLNRADAIEWLNNYCGAGFDLIVDDLFAENGGNPHRAVAVDPAWARSLLKHLNPGGGLVVNFESSKSLRRSALIVEPSLQRQITNHFSFSTPGYDNRIGAFFLQAVSRATLKENLAHLENRYGRSITRRIRARIQRL
ncbi:methyltransferase domain-containing protein [Proteobacteria bacterium 005FR1]|nr:methyltransferase domain-containing protein [Proteobacteria bacterium 005FR1]